MTAARGDREGAMTGIRWLVVVNAALVALQAVSAGVSLSGYVAGATMHRVVAPILQVATLAQVIVAVVQWRRRRVPGWVAGFSVGLFAVVFLQAGFGYRRWFWLHVPIGVGIFSGLTRLTSMLRVPNVRVPS